MQELIPIPALAGSRARLVVLGAACLVSACATRVAEDQCDGFRDSVKRVQCHDAYLYPDIAQDVEVGAVAGAVLGGALSLALSRGHSLGAAAKGAVTGAVAGAAIAYVDDLMKRAGGDLMRAQRYNTLFSHADMERVSGTVAATGDALAETTGALSQLPGSSGASPPPPSPELTELIKRIGLLEQTVEHVCATLDSYDKAFELLKQQRDSNSQRENDRLRRQVQSLQATLQVVTRQLHAAPG